MALAGRLPSPTETLAIAASTRPLTAGSAPGRAEKPDPRPTYAQRAARFDLEAEDKRRRAARYSWLRLLVFLSLVLTLWGLVAWSWGQSGLWAAGGLVVVFIVLVRRHGRARRRLRRVELMAAFNREMSARADRSWDDIPDPPPLEASADHDYARDLDLHGSASLLQLVGTCGTGPGWATLDRWLLTPAPADEVAKRQEAVADLAGALDFRDALAAEARLLEVDPAHDVERFLNWAEGAPWLKGRRRWLLFPAWVLPFLNVALITLRVFEVVPTAAVTWSLVVSSAVLFPVLRGIHRVFAEAAGDEEGVREYGPVLEVLAGADLSSALMSRVQERLDVGERPAHQETATLRRLLDLAEVRRSPLFHLPLAMIFLWDLHVLAALERWQARSGTHVRDWLAALGESEALAALSALAHANPGWTFPTLDPESTVLDGEGLGHPLIPPSARVVNDVTVGPPGSFLLVTGSNMSGKSTLLRALGLNAVLAQAGGPVCATALCMPATRVVTSMRVDDSLAGGVSFFMAELHRLKHVVDVAEADDRRPTLYLLDEILQGTNTAERRVAARTVIRRLVDSGAIGAVTTHDLTLADAEDLARSAVAVHFTETVGGAEEGLSFDYRLRSGLAQSTNALKLLGLVGLGGDE